MQNMLQRVQLNYRIYNTDIEPEHDVDMVCFCEIHQYQSRKYYRLDVQKMWSRAVMYPGRHATGADMSRSACNNSVTDPSQAKSRIMTRCRTAWASSRATCT